MKPQYVSNMVKGGAGFIAAAEAGRFPLRVSLQGTSVVPSSGFT